MKKHKFFFGRLTILILILFVIGETAGYFTIRSMFLKYEMNELLPQAQSTANEFSSGHELHIVPGRIIAVYDTNGSQIKLNSKIDVTEGLDLTKIVNMYLEDILDGETISTIQTISGLSSIALIIGVPVEQNGKITGALFQMVPANEYAAALKGFRVTFGVTIGVGTMLIAFYFWRYYREKNRMELIKQNYLTNINHELKSPVASIMALSETLADGMVEDEKTKERYYRLMCSESKRLETMILDSLQLSKLQNTKDRIRKDKISCIDLLKPVIDKYSVICDEMGLDFSVRGEDIYKDILLYTNSDGIRQILTIFMENAVKFVDDAGVIQVSIKPCRKKIIISVSDNGIGIDEKILPHIFERFYKGNRSHNSKGSGLGLAIAKEVAGRLDEKINVKSKLGSGSEFMISVQMS